MKSLFWLYQVVDENEPFENGCFGGEMGRAHKCPKNTHYGDDGMVLDGRTRYKTI